MQAAVRGGAEAGPQGSPSAGRAWGRPEAAPYGRRRRPALRAVLLHGLAESAPPGQQKPRPGIAAEAGVMLPVRFYRSCSSS